MSVQRELNAVKESIVANTDPSILESIAKQSKELTGSGITDRAIQKGDKASDFTLPDIHGNDFHLQKVLQSGKRVVLTFYKGGWCPYCNIELKGYAKLLNEFESKGAIVVAISPQLVESSSSTAKQNHLKFPVLSDVDAVVIQKYGLLFHLAPELRSVYTDHWKMNVPAANGNDRFELPLCATYIIEPDATVSYSFVKVDYTQRAEPAEVLAALST